MAASRDGLKKPWCGVCYSAASQYVKASCQHYFNDDTPTDEQQVGAAKKVATALHELHALRRSEPQVSEDT